jgi:hypothetical protein
MQDIGAISDKERYGDGVVPLTIGVTGHRDLVEQELPEIRERVRALFTSLQQDFPDRPLRILSPLAEGADRLVAEVALELDVALTVVLPMPADLYCTDFEHQDSRDRFEELCKQADEVLELPIVSRVSPERLAQPGEHRDRQYAQLGVFLCAHSHILLALWDGKPSEKFGGTAQVVRFHHYDVMEGYSPPDTVSQQILADDDSDLVYQIVVSRQNASGEPSAGLTPLDAFWLTTDEVKPRTREIPQKYVDIFVRTGGFNRDVKKHAQSIIAEAFPLIGVESGVELPASILRIDRFFRAADWLAIHYQQRYIRMLKYSHYLMFVMALMLLFYADVASNQLLMIAFTACLALAYVLQSISKRGRWNEKYLEYRTLAEGLRVQFYWAAGGVTSGNVTKYAHDNFLQKQDVELGWIRNVMRVAGMSCDVAPNRDAAGLAFVLEQWIGDESKGGQLKYYDRKASQHVERSSRLDRLGKILGLLVFGLLMGAVLAPSDQLRKVLFVVLGIFLLVTGIREAYAFRIAEKEVVRQYQFMYRIFLNAKKRLAAAANDTDRRRILRVLGEAALDEHAEWILLHRERPLRASQLWRVEG